MQAQSLTAAFSAGSAAGCSPLVITFSDQSSGSPTAWFWDFGNGATSTLQNPSTTYFLPGHYSVSLTVRNADGSASVTRSQYIIVYGKPSVAFSVADSLGCYPFPVQFTDETSASPETVNTAWVWDLGDGTQTTVQHPSTTYLYNGNYTVSLKVTNDKGCWSVATKPAYIKVNGGVKAAFSLTPPANCVVPFTIPFLNASTGPGQLTYSWDFGDGNTTSEANPAHTYTSTGNYSVMLITQSSEGCADTLRKENLLQLENTNTSFAAPDNVCVNDTVLFSNTSSSTATSVLWEFGDGTRSSAANPVKTYTSPGTYHISLVQNYGICMDSFRKEITVLPRASAAFTAAKTTFCEAPFTVHFQNASAGATTYYWSFGDGSTSTEVSPSHTYTTYGNFDVMLVAVSASGCTDTVRVPGYIKLNKPSIQFPSLPASGCSPLKVSFQALVSSPDTVISYEWDFGNGNRSIEASPVFTYAESGSYAVSLTVKTASGCTETFTLPNAVSAGKRPVAAFSAEPTSVCAFQPVQFTNQSQEATTWQWDFGDGGTSTLPDPGYHYSDTGTFSVTLIASNNGCSDSLEIPDYITIRPPIAKFEYQTSCTNKLEYTFSDKSVGATAWQWDFGDGTTSTQQNPAHTFPDLGTYTVQLTVTNDTCSHTFQAIIKIVNGTPDFTALPPAACKGMPVQFAADTTNAANIVRYSWRFGDSSPLGSGMTATTVYKKVGTYDVSLAITDINGCTDSIVKKQFVRISGPTAGLQARNNDGCKGLQATFTDASSDDGEHRIMQWKWNLGDGTVIHHSSPVAVQHVYSQAGRYDLGLTVTDEGGCSDSLLLPSLVRTSDIKADFVSADTASCPGAAIRFLNTSKTLTTYTSTWRFGDGTESGQRDPTTFYKQDGLYTVKLNITDANGCTDSVSKEAYIAINRPVASFTVSDSVSACIPFQVHYTNTSTYFTEHIWSLNGGTSRLNNPTQYYNTPGIYETKLIVKSRGGCSDTATQTISVFDMDASSLHYLPLSGCKPLLVDVHALTPAKMNFIWDFGDGTIINSSDTVRQHVYNYFGDFVPKIIMKNESGCVVAFSGSDTIRIKGATAKFGLDRRLLCDSGLVRFSDSTTFNSPVTSYHWNFGDGASSVQPSPAHSYTRPGTYQVSLSVKTENQCVDTFRLQYPVKVVASPVIRIGGDTVICAGEGITHIGQFERADTSTIQWGWQFPNGKTATVQMPQHQLYLEPGKFVVQTMAENSSGCRDTAYQPIYVNPIPTVTLPSTITTMIGTPVLLPAVYSDTMKTYQWTVPEGLSCTTCPQPMALPRFDTKYHVYFEDRNGCRNEGQVQVIVLCNNDNIFIPNTFSPNGDGSNDAFYIRGKGLSRVKTLRIFNRWGQVVFEKVNFNVNDASAGWDGTYKGAGPVPDVYVYQAEIYCDNSQVVKLEGNVSLIQ